MNKTDITDSIGDALREEALRRGARFFRLERGTLQLRHPETLATQHFLDEEDAIGQLLEGKPPKRGVLKTTKEQRERRRPRIDDDDQEDIL